MTIIQQINQFISRQPEPKQSDLQRLHLLMLQILPGCKLWFDSGVNSENRTINNPTIGYGSHTMKYADGKSKEVFQVGLSANATGISVYILGIKDKNFLVQNYAPSLGKAKVTGYCIRFKMLKDINIETLEAAIRGGVEASKS